MKRCPKCNSQYSDATLSFCLQDGTPLVDVKQSSVDTVAFNGPVTAEKILPTQGFIDVSSNNASRRDDHQLPEEPYRPRVQSYQPYPVERRQKKRHTFLKVSLIVFPLLLVLGAGGVVGWLYLSNQKRISTSERPSGDAPSLDVPVNSFQKTPASISNTRVKTSSVVTTANAGAEDVRKQITQILDEWKGDRETCNLDDYTTKYGERVEYLGRHGVTAPEITGDLRKICDAYSTIAINIDNMVIAVGAEHEAATAIFDKEWRYEASPKLAQGKVHMELHFRRVGDSWKIVGEENLKTYYSKS